MTLESAGGLVWKGLPKKITFRVVRHNPAQTQFQALLHQDSHYDYTLAFSREPSAARTECVFTFRRTIRQRPEDYQEIGQYLISGRATFASGGGFAEHGPSAAELLFPEKPRPDFLARLAIQAHKYFELHPKDRQHQEQWDLVVSLLKQRYRIPEK